MWVSCLVQSSEEGLRVGSGREEKPKLGEGVTLGFGGKVVDSEEEVGRAGRVGGGREGGGDEEEDWDCEEGFGSDCEESERREEG